VLASEGLRAAEPLVRRELATARAAWPQIADGLPAVPSVSLRRALADAGIGAARLPEPSFMLRSAALTGPAAGLAGIWESYSRLSRQGWRMLAATAGAASAGSSGSAFARANSSLYIDAVYDAHFDLSLLGKSLLDGYRKLGGARAFGARLTPAEIDSLAAAYSIPSVRLEPHPASRRPT
jgi:hypothetical protein